MDGDGSETVEQRFRSGPLALPSVLAQLDDGEPATRRAAVGAIRAEIDDRPDPYVPTVPKLRTILTQSEPEVDGTVAYCLAELAEAAPADVEPSVDEIVRFVADNERSPATRELFRCLAAVAAERPDAVVDHVDVIVDALATRRGYDRWGLQTLAYVSRTSPAALEAAVPVLTDALAANPETNGVPALSILGRVAREGEPPSLSFVDQVIELVDHHEAAIRRNALGCLADVAHRAPSAVEPVCARLGPALESEDPRTRANAAVTVGRIAVGRPDVARSVEPQVLSLLDDEIPQVRANACVAAGHGELTESRSRLSALSVGDADPGVRDRAAWAHDRLS